MGEESKREKLNRFFLSYKLNLLVYKFKLPFRMANTIELLYILTCASTNFSLWKKLILFFLFSSLTSVYRKVYPSKTYNIIQKWTVNMYLLVNILGSYLSLTYLCT